MGEVSVFRPPLLVVAIVAALLMAVAAGGAPAVAHAQKCNPACVPPPPEGEEETPKTPPPPPLPKVLVVNVGWQTDIGPTSSPLSAETLQFDLAYLRGTVNPWLGANAPGISHEYAFEPGGSYMIAAPTVLSQPGGCAELGIGGNRFFEELVASGDAAASAHGFSLSSYEMVIYVWSHSICSFRGITDKIGGRRLGLPAIDSAEHEIGHHLGLSHAEGLVCTDANHNPVSLSGSCFREEYGDPFDTMGASRRGGLYSAIYQSALGWMPSSQIVNLTASDSTHTFTLRPLSEPTQGPRAVRLLDGATTLWLEYRQPTGLEAFQLPGLTYGLMIHRAGEHEIGSSIPVSELIDVSPTGPSRSFADSALPVGQTWANPLGEMKITVNSETPSAATVTISSQRIAVPEVRGLPLAQAEEVLQGNGFRPVGGGTVVDPTCTFLGVVASESPAPGSRALPGASVNIAVGEQDLSHQCQ
jgi:hypothetical protein